MAGLLSVLAEFMGQAILIATVLGLTCRAGNIFVRAAMGKEDWF